MPELDSAISTFLEKWGESSVERNSTYALDSDQIEEDQIPELIEDVETLAESFNPGSLEIEVDAGEDRYDVDWDPNLGVIQSDPTSGDGYDIADLYDDDEATESAIRTLSNDRLRSVEDLIDTLEVLIHRGDIELTVDFGIEKRGIVRKLEENYSFECLSLQFYFSFGFFERRISNMSPENFRDEFLDDGDRLAFVIHEFDSMMCSDDFAVTGLGSVGQLSEWASDGESTWEDVVSSVATQSLIENVSSVYLPPSFFEFESEPATSEEERVEALFESHSILFSILSITSSAQQDGGMWDLQISGKQLIQGRIQVSSDQILVRDADQSETTFQIEGLDVENFHSLFKWAYLKGNEPETRLPIVRNVTTLFAQDLSEVVGNISEIHGSIKSNYQYYVEQTTDDFFEFRQELIDSAFETNSRFSDLRSQLINSLSRDIFRTIAFILVIGATVYYRLPESVDSNTVFTILLSLIFIYGLVVLRRVRGIHHQLDMLVEDRSSAVDFYGKFFDENEKEEYQLKADVEGVWFQGLFDSISWTRGKFEFEYTIAYDLLVYYLLVGVILAGTVLGIVDINMCDLASWFPP
ncbi:hypothetical protein [Haloarcula marina]|uniref:hypothetical protein n=1 Tax=Haloarcula marina TaxID=2961574 RepID=UPI0020B6E6A9|nr:hypothetical protein [Halomicroarcula marina]